MTDIIDAHYAKQLSFSLSIFGNSLARTPCIELIRQPANGVNGRPRCAARFRAASQPGAVHSGLGRGQLPG